MSYSCPFIKGSAVYKARAIYQNLHPEAIIDTRTICLSGLSSKTTEPEPEIILNNQVVSSSYHIYPNPVQEQLNIEWQASDLRFIELRDIGGQILAQQTVEPGSHRIEIDMSGYASGIYLIQLKNNLGAVYMKKVIK